MTDTTSMNGKTVLITGGTVGSAGQQPSRWPRWGPGWASPAGTGPCAERAAAAIVSESGNTAVDVFVADMSSQAEVRRLADEVLATYPRLDVLLNNVGGFRRIAT